MSQNNKPITTYVTHENVDFFVSTTWHQSSANVWNAETVGWKHINGKLRGSFVALATEGPALDQHMDMVKQLFETGEYQNAEDSECG